MLICRRKSNRIFPAFDYFTFGHNDWYNFTNLDRYVLVTKCRVQNLFLSEENRRLRAMEAKNNNKRIFSKAEIHCPCDNSSTPCPHNISGQQRLSTNGKEYSKESMNSQTTKEKRRSISEKKSKPKQIPPKETAPVLAGSSSVVASCSNYGAYLRNVSTNYHCPNTHQSLLFNNYLQQSIFHPLQHSPAYSFYRSFSETSMTEQQNSNDNYTSSSKRKSKESMYNCTSSRALSTIRSTSVNAIRKWQHTHLGKLLERVQGGEHPGIFFKVMSYNILAQDLLSEHPELYLGNEKKAMQWEIRWKNLYNEIKEHDCDILCLQEVQKSHLDKYFNKLSSLRYSIVYKQRTGIRTDGCAIYYKSDEFNLVEYATVEFKQPNISLLDRDNVGIIATFSPKQNPSCHFVVATTHLLYNPKRQDVRLAQTQVFLAEIERLAYRKLPTGQEMYIPIIITGDFNSLPVSPIYQFIVGGKYNYENVMLRTRYKAGKVLIPHFLYITDNCQHADLLENRKQSITATRSDELKLIRLYNSEYNNSNDRRHCDYHKYAFSSGVLSHNFGFLSAYKHNTQSDAEGTTFQDKWVTVDYIFYSGRRGDASKVKESKLKLMARYTLPTTMQLRDVRIPNLELGSDHLSLIAKFKLEY